MATWQLDFQTVFWGITDARAILDGNSSSVGRIDGVYVITDYVLVAGEGPTTAVAEQDLSQKLHALLNRCKETGMELNKDRFCLQLQAVAYMGHL